MAKDVVYYLSVRLLESQATMMEVPSCSLSKDAGVEMSDMQRDSFIQRRSYT